MIKANTTLKEIGNILAAADSVLLFPHMNPDPDGIGSSMALCRALRGQGKTAWIILDSDLPGYMKYMEAGSDGDGPDGPLITLDQEILSEPDICVSMDGSDDSRITGREEIFHKGRTSLCIDHHLVKECDRDHYYIDPDAAATAQLIFTLMKEMDWPMDERIATDLYTGINGDTGCFMYSNTTPGIMRISAELMELGADTELVNVNLHQSRSLETVKVTMKVMETLDMFADGKAAMARLTKEMLESCNAKMEAADQVIDDLRSIEGVEIAAFVKEDGEVTRVNMRAKTCGNVAEIAERHGGGGHAKAAGFREEAPLEQVYETLREEIRLALE